VLKHVLQHGTKDVLNHFGQNIDAKNVRMELTMFWTILVRTSKVTPKIVPLDEMGQNFGEPDLDALILKIG
jgi:hypothetical protein